MSLILASTSSIRAHMLEAAGVRFTAAPPLLDEQPIKRDHDRDGRSLALKLAEAKAASVGKDGWVIGSDSVVEVEGAPYSKPRDRHEAAAHLAHFSGRQMNLSSAVALAREGHVDWSVADTATLTFRHLSQAFIDEYLDHEWPEVGYCVGVFRMEGRGVTLFERIEGSHFTILGMPLLPLLGALRQRGLLTS